MKDLEENSYNQQIEEFIFWLEKEGKAESTIKTYLSVLDKFHNWLEGKDLQSVKQMDVQNYISHLEQENKSPGTVEKYLAALSVYARFSGISDIILNIEKKEKVKDLTNPDFLNEQEAERLLSDVEKDGNLRNIAIIYLLLHTGIKISEMCSLNRSDIEITDDKGKVYIRNNNIVERMIPLSSRVVKHLERYMQTLNYHVEALFVTTVNKRISPRGIQYMLEKYEVNPNKLRHTFCKRLVDKGVDVHTVSRLAGHKDINVTKRYLNEDNIDLEKAINQAF